MKINEHTTQEDINNFLKKEFNEDLFHRDLYSLLNTCYEGIVNPFYIQILENFDSSHNTKKVIDQISNFINLNFRNKY